MYSSVNDDIITRTINLKRIKYKTSFGYKIIFDINFISKHFQTFFFSYKFKVVISSLCVLIYLFSESSSESSQTSLLLAE